jgi:hypothetical protein
VDNRPHYYNLEEPAHLGREFPTDSDPYVHYPRNRSAGSLVFLDLLLVLAAAAYTSEGAWGLGLVCGISAVLCAIPAYRWMRRLVKEEMEADPTETLKTLVDPPPERLRRLPGRRPAR